MWPFTKKKRPLGEIEKRLMRGQVNAGVSERRVRSEWGSYDGFDAYYALLLADLAQRNDTDISYSRDTWVSQTPVEYVRPEVDWSRELRDIPGATDFGPPPYSGSPSGGYDSSSSYDRDSSSSSSGSSE